MKPMQTVPSTAPRTAPKTVEEIDFTRLAGMVPRQHLHPIAALRALARLIKDPEDTQQVALMGIALAGRSQHRVFQRFIAHPTGQAVIREKRSLAKTLDDRAYLRGLAENSLGRHYLAFMEREGLSAQGLIDATPAVTEKLAQMPEPVRLFSNYSSRDMHDLYHVLTGYGRDELGEICVLAMSYQQLKIRAFKLISTVGPFIVRKYLRRAGLGADGVFAAVREAAEIGRKAAWIPSIDMQAALAEDIDALRARLNIARPEKYFAVIARIRAARTNWHNGPLSALGQPDVLS
jgi:ubiquinone biosynthesis protein COQ4